MQVEFYCPRCFCGIEHHSNEDASCSCYVREDCVWAEPCSACYASGTVIVPTHGCSNEEECAIWCPVEGRSQCRQCGGDGYCALPETEGASNETIEEVAESPF